MMKLFFLILLSPTTNVDKMKTMYHITQVQEISITCAIIKYETGHLQCYKSKVICSQKCNNLFGFRYKDKYLEFSDYSSSVVYYRNWQKRKWDKYQKKNHDKTYYDFLKHVGYCNSMNDYIKVIKRIQKHN